MNDMNAAVEAFCAAARGLAGLVQTISDLVAGLSRPCPAPRPRVPMFVLSQPRTLQEAIARKPHYDRPYLPARSIRTPATRRR